MLRQYAGKYGYEVIVVEKIKEDSRDISSTFVREEIAAGNIEKANHLLGYRYFVTSRVLHGNQIGRTIGVPTINQLPPKERPAAERCLRDGGIHRRPVVPRHQQRGVQAYD